LSQQGKSRKLEAKQGAFNIKARGLNLRSSSSRQQGGCTSKEAQESELVCARTSSTNAHTELTLPLMPEVLEAEGSQPAKMDCSASPLESKNISAGFLAGAAALGLRLRRNKAISEPPVKQCACFNVSTSKNNHVTNNDLKEEVFADERSAIAKSEQKLTEAILVPHAPRRPQPESHRKRPQIRGVPILVIPNN